MQITCWGTRGSLPSSGMAFAKYGGDTISIEIRSKSGDLLIIDAGSGIRKLSNNIVNCEFRDITLLITHYHLDHIMGTPFFKQLFDSRYKLNILGPKVDSAPNIESAFQTTISPPFFPLGLDNMAIKAQISFKTIDESTFRVGSLTVKSIRLNHTNGGGLGYRIEEGDNSFVFLTDNELSYKHPGGHSLQEYVKFSLGADLLLHDAQYTDDEYETHKGWGHSTPSQVAELARLADVNSCGFFHYDIDRTDDEVEKIYSGYKNSGDCSLFPVIQGATFLLE